MPMPFQPWRAALVPASFRGAFFNIDSGGQSGGRRGPTHEFPMRDTPWSEDLGRKARRWPITGYVIGPLYQDDRDALIAACEAEGAGTLVHPTLGEMLVKCDSYALQETRERGGICTFSMVFSEEGSLNFSATTDTQSAALAAAQRLGAVAAAAGDAAIAKSNSNS